MRTGLKSLSTVAVGGGLALALAGPAQAAVPESSCDTSTTVAVVAGPSVGAGLVSALTKTLQARGFTAAPAAVADLSATIAPANEISAKGSPAVMAVALSDDALDPTTAAEGTDWAAIQGDPAEAANQLLDAACGPLPAEPDPVRSTAQAEPSTEESSAAPAEDQVTDAAATREQDVSAPATEEASAAAPATAAASAAVPATPEQSAAPAQRETTPAAAETEVTVGSSTAAATQSAPTAAAAAPAQTADKDCGDFGSQAEAQTFFEDNGGPASDVHRLDADDDGRACEAAFGEDSSSPAPVAAASSDRDCPDFGTRAEAQTFFAGNGGPAADPHRLDRDNDGQACEEFFVGDNSSRAEARMINAGTPAEGGISPVGLAGGALLAGAGVALGLRARRL
ncbi:hypothetical protein [Janibacter sp. GS2]|uniref:hypothetical protein n=1 Tax=Janibacter sp. GS2 TaxID=3442646 RepID=UPI003EB930B5